MGRKTRQRLDEIIAQLSDEQAAALLEFAESLFARPGPRPDIETPPPAPRPAGESVLRAIKRLRAAYPTLDPAKLLDETAALMTAHVVHGRAAGEVIDELEALFRQYHERSSGKGK